MAGRVRLGWGGGGACLSPLKESAGLQLPTSDKQLCAGVQPTSQWVAVRGPLQPLQWSVGDCWLLHFFGGWPRSSTAWVLAPACIFPEVAWPKEQRTISVVSHTGPNM